MKLKIFVLLSPLFFGVLLLPFLGCNRTPPLMPPPPPTPTPDVIWANGSAGTWFTNTLTAQCGACSTSGSVTAVSDPLSGDTSALLLSAAGTPSGFYAYQASVTVNPSNYYTTGHLQFDILLGQPASNITSMNVQYNSSISGNYAQYNFPGGMISSFSQSSFTHVSIPFTAFSIGNGYSQVSIDTPFQISWSVSSSGTTIILDSIRWTNN